MQGTGVAPVCVCVRGCRVSKALAVRMRSGDQSRPLECALNPWGLAVEILALFSKYLLTVEQWIAKDHFKEFLPLS